MAYKSTKEEIRLDLKDKKIIAELDLNAREHISTIAKRIKLSKQAVEYRINRMIEKGIIKNFYTIINVNKLGYNFYRLAIKFQNTSPEKEKEIFDFVSKYKQAGWIFALNGVWDAAFVIYSKDIVEFEKIEKEIVYRYSENIMDKSVSIVTSIYQFGDKYLYSNELKGNGPEYLTTIGGEKKAEEVDEQDIQILKLLSLNARISLVDMASKLKVSPKTVDYRIKSLIEKGVVVGFKTNFDPSLFGYEHYKVFLDLQSMNEKKEEAIFNFLKSHPNMIFCTKAIGLADIEFELKAKNIMEFYELMKELKQKFPDNIKKYDYIMIIKEHLLNYFPF